MFFRITIAYVLLQIYFLVKTWGFTNNVLSERHRKIAKPLILVFFTYINVFPLYISIAGRPDSATPAWFMYLFEYPFFTWNIACIGMAVLFIPKDIVTIFWRIGKKIYKSVRNAVLKRYPPEQPVDFRRRRLISLASASLAIPPVATAAYGTVLGSKEFFINRLEIPYPKLHENLRGFRIAQLSDLHCSQYTSKEDIARAVKVINDENVDLVLLTGDYVPMEPEFIYPCMEALKELNAKHGVYASVGNHEIWTNERLIVNEIQKHGVSVLKNSGVVLPVNDTEINVLGVDDSRWGNADVEAALKYVKPGNFNLLMSHQPRYWDRAKNHGIDLTLAGHTHGGQIGIKFFGNDFNFGDFFGHKYNKGLYTEKQNDTSPDRHLYVNQGFGYTFLPVRLNTPPEITLITLV